MATLVIIDMQEHFLSARDTALQESICDLIAKQKSAGGRIVLVEYSQCGKSVTSIRSALAGYDHVITVKKRADDGSTAILTSLRKVGWLDSPEFILCGVNTPYCVLHTARGLEKKLGPRSSMYIDPRYCNTTADTREIGRKLSEVALYTWQYDNVRNRNSHISESLFHNQG